MNKIDHAFNKCMKFTKNHLPEILTIAGTVGVGSTIYLTRKCTKAEEILQNEGKMTGMEPIEAIETYTRLYWPVLISGIGTVGCLWGARILDECKQANLLSAYMALGQAFEKYRRTVKMNVDDDTFCKIEEEYIEEMRHPIEPSTDQILFFEPHYGKFFNSTMVDVLKAEYEVNREMALGGASSLSTFLDALGLYPIVGSDQIGWSQDAGLVFYGYGWIEFIHEKGVTDDGLEYYYIKMPFEPTPDYLDYGIGQIIS